MSDRPWGVIEHGKFRALPKLPMVHAGLGPPPFSFNRPTDGRLLHIVEEPAPEPELICDWEMRDE